MAVPHCKIVLIGNSGVGKTSLVNSWMFGTHGGSVNSTIGANHQRKRVVLEGESLDLFIWDTAGQEQYQSLAPLYVRSAAVAIITISFSDPATLISVDAWADMVSNASDNPPPIVLAANKYDLINISDFNTQKVESMYLKRFPIIFCSALTGEGVDNLFELAARTGLDFLKNGDKISQKVLKEVNSQSCC